ncbi:MULTISPECIES: 3-oxoacid CoA-transferase subunit B [unclassified Mycobacterium]|uniref:3-oxoacid CoA-transferase subunit B n=1 Tax=unclassified Mycobacterium TaxID=2642494 RepID=UPI0029C76CD7|nr:MULTISPECIES: 3-oxoacid CoA-transferase subunit B [unclassified Mycobacterium]
MTAAVRRSRNEIAARVARDLPDGACVNLGIGIPTLIADHLPDDRELLLHSENGMIGIGPTPAPELVDPELINAGKLPVTMRPGGSFFSHAEAFVMIRGGHVDVAVMGAYEVSASGDLANWSTGDDGVPAIGGAMDLAVGARQVFVVMSHQTSSGRSKLVTTCSYPLTAAGVVKRVYTDIAVLEVRDGAFVALEIVEGLDLDDVRAVTDAPILAPDQPAVTKVTDTHPKGP